MNKNKYQKNPKPIKEQEKKKYQENSEPKRCEKSSTKKRI